MKTQRRWILFLLAAVLIASNAPHEAAGEMPTLDVMEANVLQTVTPPSGYQVRVNQTVSMGAGAGAATMSADAQTTEVGTPYENPFVLTYDPAMGLSTAEAPVEQTLSTESTLGGEVATKETVQPGPDLRVTVEYEALFQDLAAMDNVSIVPEVRDGRDYYHITARSGIGEEEAAFEAWVDAERWYITEAVVSLFGQPFSHSTFTYRNYGTVWLPSRIVVYHFGDGSEVVQDYGEYVFAQ